MRRLLIRHPDTIGLLIPADLVTSLWNTLRMLAVTTNNIPKEQIEMSLRWLEALDEKRGRFSVSSAATMAGVGYDAALLRLNGFPIEREGRMIALPPATAVRLAWQRLLLSANEPPVDDGGGYWLVPITRATLRIMAMEWHSLMSPPQLRELAQVLIDAGERGIRGDHVAQLIGENQLRAFQRLWQRVPVAVRVVTPSRTLAATLFSTQDLVRLWWNKCVVEKSDCVLPDELA